MKPLLIGISGKAGTGKDTLALLLASMLPHSQILKFATPLKEAAAAILHTPVASFEDPLFKKTLLPGELQQQHSMKVLDENTKPFWVNSVTAHDYRWFLQVLGTEVSRQLHPAIWIWSFFNSPRFDPTRTTLISDVRFKNEANEIVRRGGILLRVENSRLPKPTYLYSTPHASEVELDNYPFDHTIHNNGTLSELESAAFNLYKQLTEQLCEPIEPPSVSPSCAA